MANITIKELISADSLSEIIDKINFNFDQLLLNGGGPEGPLGLDGPIGPVGARGTMWFNPNDKTPSGGDNNDPNEIGYTISKSSNPNIVPANGDIYLDDNSDIWEFDSIINLWYNSGSIQGAPGIPGAAGQSEWNRINDNDDEIIYPNLPNNAPNSYTEIITGNVNNIDLNNITKLNAPLTVISEDLTGIKIANSDRNNLLGDISNGYTSNIYEAATTNAEYILTISADNSNIGNGIDLYAPDSTYYKLRRNKHEFQGNKYEYNGVTQLKFELDNNISNIFSSDILKLQGNSNRLLIGEFNSLNTNNLNNFKAAIDGNIIVSNTTNFIENVTYNQSGSILVEKNIIIGNKSTNSDSRLFIDNSNNNITKHSLYIKSKSQYSQVLIDINNSANDVYILESKINSQQSVLIGRTKTQSEVFSYISLDNSGKNYNINLPKNSYIGTFEGDLYITSGESNQNTVAGNLILMSGKGPNNQGSKIEFRTSAMYESGISEKMVLDHSGNLGIGTSAPTRKLDINTNNSSNTGVRIRGGTPASGKVLMSSDNNGNTVWSNDGVPIGTVVMWAGKESNIPTGWQICDGTKALGTILPNLLGSTYGMTILYRNQMIVGSLGPAVPNLLYRFIKGINGDNERRPNNNPYGNISHTVKLKVSNIPTHTHKLDYGPVDNILKQNSNVSDIHINAVYTSDNNSNQFVLPFPVKAQQHAQGSINSSWSSHFTNVNYPNTWPKYTIEIHTVTENGISSGLKTYPNNDNINIEPENLGLYYIIKYE